MQPNDVGPLGVRDVIALIAKRLAPLCEHLRRVDELHLTPPLRMLAVGENPNVCTDACVEEKLVRQADDRLHPVVINHPAPNLTLPRSRPAGEEGRAVEDDRHPRAAILRTLPLGDHMLQEPQAPVINAWQTGAKPTI